MLKNANLFLMPVFIFLTICFISGCSVNTVENREHKNGIYTGEWQFGRPHGYGTYTVRTDDILRIYEGEWRNGQRHGQGTQTRENSDGTVLSYEGGWRKDLRAGQGIQIYDRGSGETVMYEGNFAGDLIHGEGVMTVTVKDSEGKILKTIEYNGEFSYGTKHGNGRETEKDGAGNITAELEGVWENDRFTG